MTSQKLPNPLQTLGVPLTLIMREHDQGELSGLMELVESQYKSLSKRYHPDRPTGNADVMSQLTAARYELDDLETLAYYVDELLGVEDVDKSERREILRQREEQRERAYKAALKLLVHCNQFEILGISVPTSFLIDFSDERAILDVTAPDKTNFSLVSNTDSKELSGLYPRYNEGVWSEALTDQDIAGQRVQYARPRSQGEIRVIGGVEPRPDRVQDSGPVLRSAWHLDEGTSHGVTWSKASEAWFMPHLGSYRDGDHVVMMKNDSVAITGMVLASAPI